MDQEEHLNKALCNTPKLFFFFVHWCIMYFSENDVVFVAPSSLIPSSMPLSCGSPCSDVSFCSDPVSPLTFSLRGAVTDNKPGLPISPAANSHGGQLFWNESDGETASAQPITSKPEQLSVQLLPKQIRCA